MATILIDNKTFILQDSDPKMFNKIIVFKKIYSIDLYNKLSYMCWDSTEGKKLVGEVHKV